MIVVGAACAASSDIAERLPRDAHGRRLALLGVIARGFRVGRRGGYSYDYAPAKSAPPSDIPVSPNGAASPEVPVPTVNG